MKFSYIFIFFCLSLPGYSQVTQINTGTNQNLLDLSVIGNNIVICGWTGYLTKSLNDCNNLSQLPVPGPPGNASRISRIDTNTIFLISYNPSQTLVYRSSDGGYNWVQKLDTSGQFKSCVGFFDSSEGFISVNSNLIRTKNGGSSWAASYLPITFPNDIQVIKPYGDSLICVGTSNGNFYLSKDRGNTFPFVSGFWGTPTDIFFLNKDTIFAVSSGGDFTKTANAGQSWTLTNTAFITSAYGVYFKNVNEGYVVGANAQNIGVVARTTDFGETWQTFNTGISTKLQSIAFLNDSIALLTGTNGVLLKWNYKKSVFTGIKENSFEYASLKIYPNPVKDKLSFAFDSDLPAFLKLCITNVLGQNVYSINDPDVSKEVDVSFLIPGIYYLKVETDKGNMIFKIVKE